MSATLRFILPPSSLKIRSPANLSASQRAVVRRIVRRDSQQHDQAVLNGTDGFAFDDDDGSTDSLHNGSHADSRADAMSRAVHPIER